ncbi:MAG TPA: subclass B3 metallo-beta-lactamase [Gemmatimonadales bacterium]
MRLLSAAALLLPPVSLAAQVRDSAGGARPGCPDCPVWTAPPRPFRVFGNTWYVGTHGLTALLVTSDEGHVLLDAGLPESAPLVLANVRTLGFRVEDIELILNSHAHYDHAGGIAAIRRASGARVAASPASAAMLRRGATGPDDPQHGIALAFPPADEVEAIADGDTVRVGPLALTAHFTGGHTPGGTSWSWRACEGERCLDLVYADSQTPVSADDFSFTRSATYPTAIADFERGFAVLERLRCDVLLTPHPGAAGLWERLEAREAGDADALVDAEGCRRYAALGRKRLAARVAAETAKR